MTDSPENVVCDVCGVSRPRPEPCDCMDNNGRRAA